jgi:lipopolysaccharide/colanic/teichoic acid biosynthesis glycosyltransferase
MKRALDIVVAAAGLILLSPILLLISVLIKADSWGPVFFRQERIGKGFRPFRIYKFRTMVADASQIGSSITVGNDLRITKVGTFLRQTKIDEIPQLINVLKGEMSLVGPRPEVHKYVDLFRSDYEEILTVRPGITDLASLKYQDEAEVLAKSTNPELAYVTQVLPEKLKLGKDYIKRSSFIFDMRLLVRTLPRLFGCKVRHTNFFLQQ